MRSEFDNARFICAYKRNAILWNINHEHYKSKAKREVAYRDIMLEMDMGTIDEVKKKIKSLRDTYNAEKQRMIKSRRSGAPSDEKYQTKLSWYPLLDEILGSKMQPIEDESVMHTDTTSTERKVVIEEIILHDDHAEHLEEEIVTEERSTIQWMHQQLNETPEVSHEPNNKVHPLMIAPNKRRKSQARLGQVEVNGHESTYPFFSAASVAPVTPRRSSSGAAAATVSASASEDEYHFFGLSMASQLRALPRLNAIILQEKIQSLIARERIEYEHSLMKD
ncbi:uncharacterized protein LOC129752499 [Uranotaenia lowii]|uniref:uncharacterized protein LOC129752499 n=1 Tax=Uranotaenia lowii TaxID=190385 RepID=UPI00247AC5DD|nr:uncharacterized protein LOC129752499 [Uranotaenia lowii]